MIKTVKNHRKSVENRIKLLIPVLAAGIFFLMSVSFLTGAASVFAAKAKVRKGVYINDIDVGGCSVESAKEKVLYALTKELKEKSLVVKAKSGAYVFAYPEIGYKTDIDEVLKNASSVQKAFIANKAYTTKNTYYLNGLDGVVQMIASNEKKTATEAEVSFNPDGSPMFIFTAEKDGEGIDVKALTEEIEKSLNNGFYEIAAKTYKIKAEITQKELKKYTFLKSRFTTYYGGSTAERKHNIALCSAAINGLVLAPGEEFSFNKTVGPRTAERGYKEAKIILDGKFTEGIGGGVCQLSTTVYNAVLTAGLKITEQHPHSMPVAYVEPSFDAMVNSYTSDLRFLNDTSGKVFLKAEANGESLIVSVFGEKSEYEIKRKSVVTEEVLPPAPEIIEGDKEEIVQHAKNGIKSIGFIELYKNGKFIERRQIRKDSYKPTREIKKIVPAIELKNF